MKTEKIKKTTVLGVKQCYKCGKWNFCWNIEEDKPMPEFNCKECGTKNFVR